jgi:MscS family membrane protein
MKYAKRQFNLQVGSMAVNELHGQEMFAIIPLMKQATWIGTAVFLLLMWGAVGTCRATDSSAVAATSTAGAVPKDKNPAPQPDSTTPPQPPSTSDPVAKFTEQVTSFLDNPNITSLWTNNTLSNWIRLLLWIFVGMAAGKTCSIFLQKAGSRDWAIPTKFLLDLAGPANLFLVTLGLSFGLLWISMSKDLRDFFFSVVLLLFYISVFWYAYNLISLVDTLFHQIGRKSDSSLEMHIAPLVRRTLRVFLIVVASMFIVQSVFKQDIGAWLAGLGIAGLAVSLAAQDTLKNLFGSITIILDQSFKIGERIICTGCDGVIEDIGLRTTRVRTTAGHVVSIPNANIVNSPIENVSRRTAIRRSFTLALKLDTPAEKVKLALKIVNDILADGQFRENIHPTIRGKACKPQIFFSDYTANSLNLNIIYWYAPPNSDEYMAHAEKINLRILDEFNRAEIHLASA